MSTASTVCQGLQSCLEPQPRVLMHQLVPSKQSQESQNCWNIMQSPSMDETEKVYVHPLSKRSCLSPMSLDMCTESLGSESGSLVEEWSEMEMETEMEKRRGQVRNKVIRRQSNTSFPPPLTSISGTGVQVKTHREGGRLVITAFTCTSYFQADRHNGRLRLSLLRDEFRPKLATRCNDDKTDQALPTFPFWVAI